MLKEKRNAMDKILMRRQVFIRAAMLTLTSAAGGDVWAGPGGTNGSRGFLTKFFPPTFFRS